MTVSVNHGDILREHADVLICTANPQLNMSGGLNGEILLRGGTDIQRELKDHLRRLGESCVEPGAVVATSAGPLTSFKHIVHAVAIDGWYQSREELIETAVRNALSAAANLQAQTVALPGLAMGYGRLPAELFAAGLRAAIAREYPPIRKLHVVLRQEADAVAVRRILIGHGD
jgi:O-acetyl-ADP-ribose deacetylase (regulator of RNase III)